MIPHTRTEARASFSKCPWCNVVITYINDAALKAGEKIGSAVQSIKDFFTGGFDIHSPSKWAKEKIGKNIVLGQIEGIEETADKESINMFNSLSSFGRLIRQDAAALTAGNGGVSVNLYGNITLNNTDGDIDNLIQNIETRIYERQLGRGV